MHRHACSADGLFPTQRREGKKENDQHGDRGDEETNAQFFFNIFL